MLNELLSGNFTWLIALIIAITIHEFSHAFAAERLGDPTPRLMGRLTLNPLAHLDPLGTMLMIFTRFGWGKPVQFDPFNLQNPRKDAAIISLAGPTSNLLLATLLSLILRFLPTTNYHLLSTLILPVIFINVSLAIFNLVPIHPLDGFKIVEGILPENYVASWHQLQGLGIFLLVILILPFGNYSLLQSLILPPINFILRILLG